MRIVEVLAALTFLVIATVAVFMIAPNGIMSANGASPGDFTDTDSGPLGPADRDFLVRVRQAGLWEMPTGQQAQQRAGSARVKQVGQMLVADHTKLDEQVRALAAKLNVELPSTPNADQQGWMAELSTKTGTDYDKTFADRLRAAHGKIFAAVALVRAGTKNSEIRSFAQVAIDVVMKHMTLLESTGRVDFAALPTPPPPSPNPSK
jgi:predicted outer membrane protein